MDLTGFFMPLKISSLKVMKAKPVHLLFASVEVRRGVTKRQDIGRRSGSKTVLIITDSARSKQKNMSVSKQCCINYKSVINLYR